MIQSQFALIVSGNSKQRTYCIVPRIVLRSYDIARGLLNDELSMERR